MVLFITTLSPSATSKLFCKSGISFVGASNMLHLLASAGRGEPQLTQPCHHLVFFASTDTNPCHHEASLVGSCGFLPPSRQFSGFFRLIAEDAVCDLIDGALEIASGQGDAIQCSCNNVVSVFLFFPVGITSQAACSSNASFDLNTIPGESNRTILLCDTC